MQAVQDYVNFVAGVSNYNTQSLVNGHATRALKLAGINDHDEEISIAGDPHRAMPTTCSGSLLCYCGNDSSSNTDAEKVWTSQRSGSTYLYETAILESTWNALITGLAGITKPSGDFSFIIDVLGDANAPPVQPARCPVSSGGITTNCSYTAANSSFVSIGTTGEMEWLIERALEGPLAGKDVSIQNQGLQSDQPDNGIGGDNSQYGTIEIPCAMNAYTGMHSYSNATSIGYQSGGTTFSVAADKTNYLNSILNGAAFGAEYLVLKPETLAAFVNDTTAIPFGTLSSYGTTASQNLNMLSTTINAALITMSSNKAHSSTGTLCPLPVENVGGVPTYVPWTYPLELD